MKVYTRIQDYKGNEQEQELDEVAIFANCEEIQELIEFLTYVKEDHLVQHKHSRTGAEPNCPTAMHFRIFRRAFTRKIDILLRKITPKSIKNAFAGGCEQF